MKQYSFTIARSGKPDHQVTGIECSTYTVTATVRASSLTQAKQQAIKWMAIPGVYSLRLYGLNAAGHGVGAFYPEIDTRNHEDAAIKVKK